MTTSQPIDPEACWSVMDALGYPEGSYVRLNDVVPVLTLGDPASLYVCSDAALQDTPDVRWEWSERLASAAADTVITGSTAPRAALSVETLDTLVTECQPSLAPALVEFAANELLRR